MNFLELFGVASIGMGLGWLTGSHPGAGLGLVLVGSVCWLIGTRGGKSA